MNFFVEVNFYDTVVVKPKCFADGILGDLETAVKIST